MFPTIVLVAFFATVTNAKGACYVPNGIDRHSLSNIGDNDNAGIIGGAVSGSVAAVMVLGLTWFIWLRRRKAAKSSGASNMVNMVELNSGERKELYSQRMPPGYSRQPSELPTTAPLIELGGGNLPPGAAR
ncbi:hypothetical protein CGCS363_v013477 [Colletotrichum siamense]|uniref:uncharacterized protein n=1 Tax=Colletotrichum siamense TaxID=690259 RepID=UPI001872F1EE|nr:uncharacterized protein CGCS363_v013477 [Colletotrichum siamense]KAF5487163.1 hypothetical protein CGCS363_v013477 [Colletotrichum siamense]